MMAFQQLLADISRWDTAILPSFGYDDRDEYGLIIRKEEPSRLVKTLGHFYAMAVNPDNVRLLFWSPHEPSKHIFVFVKELNWNRGSVTFCWIEKRLTRTWEWNPRKKSLDPSIPEHSGMEAAATEFGRYIRSVSSSTLINAIRTAAAASRSSR